MEGSGVGCGYSTVIVTKMVPVMVGSMVIVEPLKDVRRWWQPRDYDVGGQPMGCLTSGGGRGQPRGQGRSPPRVTAGAT